MQNCPGWSMAGGPWITDETAQRRLVGAATHVKADGQARAVTLKRPDMPHPKARDYHDVAVLAFPTIAGDTEGELVPRNPLTSLRILDPAPAATPAAEAPPRPAPGPATNAAPAAAAATPSAASTAADGRPSADGTPHAQASSSPIPSSASTPRAPDRYSAPT